MDFNKTVRLEAMRGLTEIRAIRHSGVKLNNELLQAKRQLEWFISELDDGMDLDQGDACIAINISDSISDLHKKAKNGIAINFLHNCGSILGQNAGLKLMLIGLALGAITFLTRMNIDHPSVIVTQVVPAIVTFCILIVYSTFAAAVVVKNQGRGLIADFIAAVIFLVPVFAATLTWEHSVDPITISRGILVEARIMSVFFLVGIVPFILETIKNPEYARNDNNHLNTHVSAYLTDPNYSSDQGYVSDITKT